MATNYTTQHLMDLLQAGDSGYAQGYGTGYINGGEALKRWAYVLAATTFVIGIVTGFVIGRL